MLENHEWLRIKENVIVCYGWWLSYMRNVMEILNHYVIENVNEG